MRHSPSEKTRGEKGKGKSSQTCLSIVKLIGIIMQRTDNSELRSHKHITAERDGEARDGRREREREAAIHKKSRSDKEICVSETDSGRAPRKEIVSTHDVKDVECRQRIFRARKTAAHLRLRPSVVAPLLSDPWQIRTSACGDSRRETTGN